MRVAFRAEVIKDESVVWIIRFLKVAAVECYSDIFPLLRFGILECVHPVACVDKVLLSLASTLIDLWAEKTYLAGHENDKYRSSDIRVHTLLTSHFEYTVFLLFHRFDFEEWIPLPASTDKPPFPPRIGL